MIDLFLSPHSLPFAISLAVVFGLFSLELLSAILGSSLMGIGGEGVDLDLDVDVDADFDLSGDMSMDAVDMDADVELADGPSGILTWLGIRNVPFLIWLVSFLTVFGLFGLILQATAEGILGTALGAGIASLIVVIPSLAVTRVISNWVSQLMPKTESSAMRLRYLGGHRGVITQGTAARGKPAEAKIKDRHGNFHYLRVEPLEDDETFPKGSDVTLIRKRGDKFFVI